jgi:membrane fusion protein (multidrug efflux system)
MTRARRAVIVAVVMLTVAAVLGCRGKSEEAPASEPTPEVSVTVAPIVRTTMHAYVTGWGTIEPEPATDGRPAATAHVAAPVSGLVTDVRVSEGQHVAQGATLFKLDSRITDVAVEHARQGVRFAEQLVQRQERLGPGEATSQKAYQEAQAQLTTARSELETTEAQRRLLDVKAPLDGTVVKLNTRTGDAVDPSTVLAELVDLNRLVVTASIRSVEAQQVKRGQRIELSPGTGSGTTAAAPTATSAASTIEYIGPQVNTATDTVLVRGRIPSGSAIKPGQFVNVRVMTGERPDRLAVPVESVLQGQGGSEVALVQGDMAVRTAVKTGLREGTLVEVGGDGIREGASVVVQGAYGLPAKSKIKIIGH